MNELPNQDIPPVTNFEQRRQIQEMARAFRQSQVLFTCVDLGVFDQLARGPASAAEIAQAIAVSERGLALLLNVAVAAGLLEKNGELYSNTPTASACLTTSSPGNLAQSLRLESAFYRRWGLLSDAVRTGRRPEENSQDEKPDDWVRTFIYALYNASLPAAPAVAEALALPEDRPLRVIDVGGGHGGYSLALARRYPLLQATVFELPRVVPVAREIIAQAGLAERVCVQEGNFQNEELGGGYDVALAFGVLNGEPLAGRPALLKKVFDALAPGGLVAIRDHVLSPDRTAPAEAALFALQMLLSTDSGGLDTLEDWTQWLKAAGFKPARAVALPEWVGGFITVAQKP